MKISEIQAPYVKRLAKYNKLREQIKRLEKRLDKMPHPNWVELLVKPIARELAKAYPDRRCEVLGPFGLGAQVSIHFYKKDADERHLFDDDNCLSITFSPGDLEKGELQLVNEGAVTGDYPPGTLGAVNGLNHPRIPISPDSDVSELLAWLEKDRVKKQEEWQK
jgi:hypothetical protein